MNVKELSTMIYDKLPEVDILKYEDTWLNSSFYYQTALKSYWFFKHEIDADKILRSPACTDKMNEIIQIIKSCRNLEQVKLAGRYSYNAGVELRSLIKVICDRPLIKCLKLRGMILYKEELLQLGRCSMLEVLSIKIAVKDEYIEEIFKNCPKLHSLTLIEEIIQHLEELIRNQLCGTWLMTFPKNMLVLKLHQTTAPIPAECLRRTLERSRNLQVLYVDQLRNGANFMNDLEELVPFLQDLKLGSSVRLDNFGRLIYLKRLTLLDVSHVDNKFYIRMIADNCPALEDLTLLRVRYSMRSLAYIGNIKKLTKLSIKGHYDFSMEMYTNYSDFLTSCRQLQYLQIRSLDLNDETALQIIENFPDLRYIEIQECFITSIIIRAAARIVDAQSRRDNGRTSVLKLKLYIIDLFDDQDLMANLEEIKEDLKHFPLLELVLVT